MTRMKNREGESFVKFWPAIYLTINEKRSSLRGEETVRKGSTENIQVEKILINLV